MRKASKQEVGGESPHLVEVFRSLALDYRERVKRYNGRGPCPVAEADEQAWTDKWLREGEAISSHPLPWLIQCIGDCTRIDSDVLKEAADRINSPVGLKAYRRVSPSLPGYKTDLTWIPPKLHELDLNGTTKAIMRDLLRSFAHHATVAEFLRRFPESNPRGVGIFGLPKPDEALSRAGKRNGDGLLGGEQGGEAAPAVCGDIVSRHRSVWRRIGSTTLAVYRITVEAWSSAFLEKLSGR